MPTTYKSLNNFTNFKTLFLNFTMSTPSYKNVDVSKWVFGELKRNASGGGSIRIKQSATNSLAPVFIMERLRTPFGVEEPYGTDDMDEHKLQLLRENPRRNMSLNVENPEAHAWLSTLDEHMINWVVSNSTTVFNKVVKRSTVEDVIYFRALQPSKKEDYSPRFRVKVNISGSNLTQFLINIPGTTNFFRGSREDVTRGSEVIATVMAYSLWVTNSQIGITFIATHLLVFPAATELGNPYAGYTEAPRPALTNGLAPAAAPSAAAPGAAGASYGKDSESGDDEKFKFDDPSDMY